MQLTTNGGIGPGGIGPGGGAAGPGPGTQAQREPTEQELLAMLEELQRLAGTAEGKDMPPDLQDLLNQVKQQKQKLGQAGQDDTPTEEITPEPGFVVKTQDDTGRKAFINMVGHPRVAAPGNKWANGVMPDEVHQALENLDNLSSQQQEALRFPLSMAAPRQDLDKKGEPATVYDCCLNDEVIKMCGLHRPLKVFVIELALNWINHKHKVQLDAKFKLPKMRYKGEQVEPHRIRVDRKPLITQVQDVQEDPVFPLVTKKLPTPATATTTASTTSKAAAAQAPGAQQKQNQQQQQQQQRDAGAKAGAGAGEGTQTQSTFSFEGASRGVGQRFRALGPPQLQGKPVDSLQVEVEVPDRVATQVRQAQAGAGAVEGVLGSVRVEVAGQLLYVSAPGCQELELRLPLAATHQGATVQLDCARTPFPVLVVRLPYMPLKHLAALAAAQAPHAPGSLQLSSNSTALELD